MDRRVYLLAALAVAVLAGAAVYVAAHTDPTSIADPVDPTSLPILAEQVPDLHAAKGWLNSDPLTGADLDGRVVVYDFWTYSCVNCVRTLPYIRAWYDRYRSDGLVVVGVHSPEFDFEKDHGNVARAVEELDVDWPVAFDDDMEIWSAFGNQYWPAKYIVDRQGRLRYTHFGEGSYTETEDVLRSLLGLPATAPRAASPGGGDGPALAPGGLTPETYLGARRGVTASPQGLVPGETTFTVPDPLPADAFALDGTWRVGQEYVEAVSPGASIVLSYQAGEVNLVMNSADGEPLTVGVEIDGKPAPGQATVTVEAADLYRLIAHGPAGRHTLRLTPTRAGLQAFAFTFGAG